MVSGKRAFENQPLHCCRRRQLARAPWGFLRTAEVSRRAPGIDPVCSVAMCTSFFKSSPFVPSYCPALEVRQTPAGPAVLTIPLQESPSPRMALPKKCNILSYQLLTTIKKRTWSKETQACILAPPQKKISHTHKICRLPGVYGIWTSHHTVLSVQFQREQGQK